MSAQPVPQCQLRPELVVACMFLQRSQRLPRERIIPGRSGVLAELTRFGRGE
jgi:hypothetical protein